ncbi:hypothetical protein BGZ95_008780, partial [Linnemannia exigua]
NQPSRSSAAPEAILDDTAEEAQILTNTSVTLLETHAERQSTLTEIRGTSVSVDAATIWEDSSQSSDIDLIDLKSIDSDDDSIDNNNDSFDINRKDDRDDKDNKDNKDETGRHHDTPVRTVNIGRSPQTRHGSDPPTVTFRPYIGCYAGYYISRPAFKNESEDIEQT